MSNICLKTGNSSTWGWAMQRKEVEGGKFLFSADCLSCLLFCPSSTFQALLNFSVFQSIMTPADPRHHFIVWILYNTGSGSNAKMSICGSLILRHLSKDRRKLVYLAKDNTAKLHWVASMLFDFFQFRIKGSYHTLYSAKTWTVWIEA